MTEQECFKCGATIEAHTSAYSPWDEHIRLEWLPASDDGPNVEVTKSGARLPEPEKRVFCSEECLEAFVQMDYSIKPDNEVKN